MRNPTGVLVTDYALRITRHPSTLVVPRMLSMVKFYIDKSSTLRYACHAENLTKVKTSVSGAGSGKDTRMPTQSVEDYLKAIYKLSNDSDNVTTSAIAARVRTTPAAVTKMLRHLQKLNLVTYTPYRGVRLTEAGE